MLLLGVMAINLITLLNDETILRHGLAGVLPVIGWVLAVLQAALAVQMVIYSLRLLEVLNWPASKSPFGKSWGGQSPAIGMSEAMEHEADHSQGDHRFRDLL